MSISLPCLELIPHQGGSSSVSGPCGATVPSIMLILVTLGAFKGEGCLAGEGRERRVSRGGRKE